MTMVMTGRSPDLITPKGPSVTPYVRVMCNGTKRNGGRCRVILGEINITHPHHVRYVCGKCGSSYELRKE